MSELREPWPDDIPISDLPLSYRVRMLLGKVGIKTVGQANQTPDSRLLREMDFGNQALRELRTVIAMGRTVASVSGSLEGKSAEYWRGKYEGAIEAIREFGIKIREEK